VIRRGAYLHLSRGGIFSAPGTSAEYFRRHEFFHFRSSFYATAARRAAASPHLAEYNAIWRQKLHSTSSSSSSPLPPPSMSSSSSAARRAERSNILADPILHTALRRE